jgi:hypothetical protein
MATINQQAVTVSYRSQKQMSDPHGIDALDANQKFLALLGGYENGREPKTAIGLFISQLRSAANSNKKPDEKYSVSSRATKVTSVHGHHVDRDIGNVQFRSLEEWMKPVNTMYTDWVNFFCSLITSLAGKQLNEDAIKFIQELSSLENTNSGEYYFSVAVVRIFVVNLKIPNDNTNYIGNTRQWDKVTTGAYKTADDIIDLLFAKDKVFIDSNPQNKLPVEVETTKINKAIKDAIATKTCPEVRAFNKYRYEEYVQKVLASIIRDVKEEVEKTTTEEPILESIKKHMGPSETQEPTEKYKYIRKPDKLLYIITKDGKATLADQFKETDPLTLEQTVCKTTGLDLTNTGVACDDFFMSCIGGRNLGDCKRFLTVASFWVDINKFIDELNLYLAHKAFIKYKIPISKSTGVWKYESSKEWHKKLDEILKSTNSEGLTEDDVKLIKENNQLNTIIDLTVEQINRWPAILNEDVIDEPVKQEPELVTLTKGFLVPRPQSGGAYGSLPLPILAPGSIMGITTGKVNAIQYNYYEALKLFQLMMGRMHGMPNVPSVPFLNKLILPPVSASNPKVSLDTYKIQSNEFFYLYNKINEFIKSIEAGMPQWLETTFNIHKSVLEQRGIKVAPDNLTSMDKVIKKLKDTEKIILTGLKGMTKYALFFETDLSPAIISMTTGDKNEDNELRNLNAIKTKTVDDMLRMAEIAVKKIEKYCNDTKKVGGICEQIALLK